MAKQWFVRLHGKERGPISSSQLKQLADMEKISPDTEVRLGPDGDWVPALRVQGLFPPEEGGVVERRQGPARTLEKETAEPGEQEATGKEPNGETEEEYGLVRESELPRVQSQLPVCPKCGQALGPRAIICVDCGYNRQTGEQLQRATPQGLPKAGSGNGPTKPMFNAESVRVPLAIASIVYGLILFTALVTGASSPAAKRTFSADGAVFEATTTSTNAAGETIFAVSLFGAIVSIPVLPYFVVKKYEGDAKSSMFVGGMILIAIAFFSPYTTLPSTACALGLVAAGSFTLARSSHGIFLTCGFSFALLGASLASFIFSQWSMYSVASAMGGPFGSVSINWSGLFMAGFKVVLIFGIPSGAILWASCWMGLRDGLIRSL